MRRTKHHPVRMIPSLPEVVDQRSTRMVLLRQIDKLEWDWDKEPTLEITNKLRSLREALCDVELEISRLTHEETTKQAIRESVSRLGEIGEAGV